MIAEPLRASHNVGKMADAHRQRIRNPLMAVETAIRDKLTRAFAPLRLEVLNESHLHSGHAGSPGTGESHFRVLIVSEAFAGKSRVERHRLVNETLTAELKGPVHALAIKAFAPGETIR